MLPKAGSADHQEDGVSTLILVRHGQTAWNVHERFRGREDIPLDEVGLAQAERTAERIAQEWSPAAVYSSPLARAMATAQAIARRCRLPVQAHGGLIDIDYGRWQGLTPDEARSRYARRAERWYRGSRWARPVGGESLAAVQRRCVRAVRRIASEHPDRVVVLVGHTVVNRLILLGLLPAGLRCFWRLQQDPCAINVIEAQDRSFVLKSINDSCHLREKA